MRHDIEVARVVRRMAVNDFVYIVSESLLILDEKMSCCLKRKENGLNEMNLGGTKECIYLFRPASGMK